MSTSYKESGVDIDKGNDFVDQIKPFAKSTNRPGVASGLGGFGGLFDLAACNFKDPILVSATDGVGTKLKIASEVDLHDTIGIDLVAMCVNDLVVQGAVPLFFLDYFSTSKLELNIATSVVKGIANGCKQAGCALIGGETAEMPGIYQPKEYDLAGFAVGAVERDEILPKNNIKKGDIILGLKSSGVHSNGFSLVRHIMSKNNLKFSDQFGDSNLGQTLLTPTKIYVKSCLEAIKTGKVKGLAHITGGGLIENISRVLPNDIKAEINFSAWQMPEIFDFLKDQGDVDILDMYRTFNCGIGMTIIIEAQDQAQITQILENQGEEVIEIGHCA